MYELGTSLYFVKAVPGMRVIRFSRYGERFGTVDKVNRKTVAIVWDDSFNGKGETRQLLDTYALTSVFPVEQAKGV